MMKRLCVLLTALCMMAVMVMPVEAKNNGKIICIDAGHQLRGDSSKEPIAPGAKKKKAKVTTGCTGYVTGNTESSINLKIAKELQKELKKRGYTVVMCRTKQKVNISNSQRAKIANKAKADAFIRIHCDSATSHKAKGASALAPATGNKYLSKKVVKKSQKLSKCVINAMCKKTGAKNRGVVKRNDLSGINWSKVPVTLIEAGFMSNKAEDKKLGTASYRKKVAVGIADGIDNYFGY